MIIKKGDTNVFAYFNVPAGATLTDLDLQYVRSGNTPSTKVDATAGTIGTHSDNTAVYVDATDSPELLQVCFPDAAFATGVDEVILTVYNPEEGWQRDLRVTLEDATPDVNLVSIFGNSTSPSNMNAFWDEAFINVTLIGGGHTTTVINTSGLTADNLIESVIVFKSTSSIGVAARHIIDNTGSSITLDEPLPTAPADFDEAIILPIASPRNIDDVNVSRINGSSQPAGLLSNFISNGMFQKTLSGGGHTTTVINTSGLTVDNLINGYVLFFGVSSLGIVSRRIIDNTATSITLDEALPSAPTDGDTIMVVHTGYPSLLDLQSTSDAIKAKTDGLNFTGANLDVNLQAILGTTISEGSSGRIAGNWDSFWDNGDTTSSKILDDIGGITSISSSDKDDIVDRVWDELRSAHTTAGSFGERVNSNLVAVEDSATIDTVAITTMFEDLIALIKGDVVRSGNTYDYKKQNGTTTQFSYTVSSSGRT